MSEYLTICNRGKTEEINTKLVQTPLFNIKHAVKFKLQLLFLELQCSVTQKSVVQNEQITKIYLALAISVSFLQLELGFTIYSTFISVN